MELMERKGLKKTEVGFIPNDWTVTNLKSISILITKGTTPSKFSKEGIPFIKIESFSGDGIDKEKCLFIDSNIHKNELKRSMLEENDVLFAIAGSIGKCSFVPKEFVPSNTNQALAIIRLKNKEAKSFVFYSLKSQVMQNYILDNITVGAQPNLNLEQIGNFTFPLPPTLEEQKAIATALSDVDDLISNFDKLISKKKAIKKGFMQQLLTPPQKGGKRLAGYKGDWLEISIDDLSKTFTKQTGFDYTNHIKPTLISKKKRGYIPFIQNKDFLGHSVNFDTDYYIPEEVAIKFPMIILNERCLMISISGSIGKVGVFNNKEIAFIGGAVAVGKFHNPEYLDWVMNFLQSEAGQNMMLKDVKAGSHQNLILDDIRKMIIPMPQIEEQKAVNQILRDFELEIEQLEVKKAKYQDIKIGMMQELLTGKTRLV